MRMLNSPNYIEVKPVHKKRLEMAEILIPHDQSGYAALTKYCAIDCEMDESDGVSVVIKVSLVNETGHILMDTFVNPEQKITKSLYDIHGIQESDYIADNIPNLHAVQKELVNLLFGQ